MADDDGTVVREHVLRCAAPAPPGCSSVMFFVPRRRSVEPTTGGAAAQGRGAVAAFSRIRTGVCHETAVFGDLPSGASFDLGHSS